MKTKSENAFDPLDALINRHMQMNQDIVKIGRHASASASVRLPGNNTRWDNTVPVPTGLFKEAKSIYD